MRLCARRFALAAREAQPISLRGANRKRAHCHYRPREEGGQWDKGGKQPLMVAKGAQAALV